MPHNVKLFRYSKFYPKRIIQISQVKKYYPEVLSKKFVIQNIPDLFYVTLHEDLYMWITLLLQFQLTLFGLNLPHSMVLGHAPLFAQNAK